MKCGSGYKSSSSNDLLSPISNALPNDRPAAGVTGNAFGPTCADARDGVGGAPFEDEDDDDEPDGAVDDKDEDGGGAADMARSRPV